MKTIVFLESNTSGSGKCFLRTALEKNFNILFLTNSPEKYSYLKEFLIQPVVIDTSDRDKLLAYCEVIPELCGIFSSSDYFVATASYLANKLGLFGSDHLAVELCRDKYQLATALTSQKIATPKSFILDEQNVYISSLNSNYPVIIKPNSGTGSIGVKLCRDETELKNYLDQNACSKLIVQEYIDGDEYSVEVIGTGTELHILGITKKYLGQPPYFVEIGHDFPAKLSTKTEKSITKEVKSALAHIGLTKGPVHIELRINQKDEIVIIEINPRLAGGMIPSMVEAALGCRLFDYLLDLYTGERCELHLTKKQAASIRFFIPPRSGTLREFISWSSIDKHRASIVYMDFFKSPGDCITLNGDFRDRIGMIITQGKTLSQSQKLADKIIANSRIILDDAFETSSLQDTGRLKKSLHPSAISIVCPLMNSEQSLRELQWLASIDEAHMIMLQKTGIVPLKELQPALDLIQKMKADNFIQLQNKIALRGLYLEYENFLVAKLGSKLGAVAHIARSRNDINATFARFNMREQFQKVFSALWQLRANVLNKAAIFLEQSMPIYSQYQPALPGSYGFYLLNIELALARNQHRLMALRPYLMECPMGAGAGCGTQFAIDPSITASLLGFETVAKGALDAVANRDLVAFFYAELALIGTMLSRIAQDYQLWTSQEFAFIDLPDELVGSSSLLPQKKNPFLLEKIKGKSVTPLSQLLHALSCIQKTPYTNSVEVGTEAVRELERASIELVEAMTLLSLIIEQGQPNDSQMRLKADHGLVTATIIAEHLCQAEGIAYREAHHKVGEIISDAIANQCDPLRALLQLLPDDSCLDAACAYQKLNYGGGPGAKHMQQLLLDGNRSLAEHSRWFYALRNLWGEAEQRRKQEIAKILHG